MTPELCEKKGLHALRMLRGNTHPPTVKALKRLADAYTIRAYTIRAALLWYDRKNGVNTVGKHR